MNELPEGWTWATLEEVCSKVQDGTHYSPKQQSSGGPYKYITAKNIKTWGIDLTEITYVSKEVHREIYNRCNPERGDVLYIKDGATTGIATVNTLDEEFSLLSSVALLKPIRNCLDSYFLKWYLNSPSGYKAMTDQMTGSAITRIILRRIRTSTIPLAPLNEQHRIVAKLEKLLSKVEACQQRLEKIPLILKRFRQSVLAAACSGRLTADWRAEHPNVESAATLLRTIGLGSKPVSPFDIGLDEIPESWSIINFGPMTVSIRGGSTAVPRNEPTNFPILRSSSVRPGYVDLEDVKYLSEKDSQNELNYLCEGDLLFTRLSGSLEYVANSALVRNLNGKRIQYPDRLFCAKLVPLMNASYCELVFAAPFIRAQITEHAKSSAGHQRVSISDIAGQLIPIAPSVEQHEIVRRVEALFKIADQIEERYQKAKAHVDKLTQSILAKAFRGELVPQDPNDEPASALLERIRKEREQTPKMKSKARRASRSEKQTGLFSEAAARR